MALIDFQNNFRRQFGAPLDSASVAANEEARLGFPEGIYYHGMVVYQQDNNTLYALKDLSQADHVDGWDAVTSNGIESFDFDGATGVLTITLEDESEDTVTIPIVNSGSVTDGTITLTTQTGQNIVLTGDVTGPQGPQGNFRFTIYQNGDADTTPDTPNPTQYTLAEDLSTTNGIPSGWTLNPDSPTTGESTYAITALVDPANDDSDNDGIVTLAWSTAFVAGSTGPSGPAGVAITGATVPQSGDDEGKLVITRDQGQPDIVTRVIAGVHNFSAIEAAGQTTLSWTEGDGTDDSYSFTVSGVTQGDAITLYNTVVAYEQGHLVASVDGSNVAIYRWNDATAEANVALTDSRWTKLLDTSELATDTELAAKVDKPANTAGTNFGGHAVFVDDDGNTLDHASERLHLKAAGAGLIANTSLEVTGDIEANTGTDGSTRSFNAGTDVHFTEGTVSYLQGDTSAKKVYYDKDNTSGGVTTSDDNEIMNAGGLEIGATSVGHAQFSGNQEEAIVELGYDGRVISELPLNVETTDTDANETFLKRNTHGEIIFSLSNTIQADDNRPITSTAVNTYAQADLGLDPSKVREDSAGNVSINSDVVIEDNHAIDFDDSSNDRAASIGHSDTNNGLEIEAVASNENIYLLPNGTGNAYVGANATGNRIVVASELEGVGGELTAAASYTQTNVTYGVDGAGDPTIVFQTLNSNVAIGNFVQAAGFDLSEAGSTSVETYTGTFTFSIGNTQYSIAPTSGSTFTWNYDSATDGTGSGSLVFDNATSTPAAPGVAVSGTIVANFGDSPFTRIQAGTGTTLTVDSDSNLTISSEGGGTGKLDTNLGNVATLTEGEGLSFSEAIHLNGIFTWPVLTGDVSHIDDFNAAFAAQVGDFTLRQGTAWSFGGTVWQWRAADLPITNSNFDSGGPALTHGGWRRLAYTIWNNLYTYQAGNVVSYQNGGGWHEYICIVDGAGGGGGSELTPPNNPTEWQLLGNEFNPTEYNPTLVYNTGDLVTADGELFQCTATTTAQPGNSTIETEGDNWRSITETLASVDSVATFPLLTPSNSIIRVGEIMCVINDPSPYNNGLYRVISHSASGTSVARVDELNHLHEIVEGIIQHSGSSATFEFPDDNPAFITGTLVDETKFTTVEGTKSTSIPSLDTVGPKFEPGNGRMTLIYSNLSDEQITQLEAAVGSDLAFRTTAGGIVTTGNVENADATVAAQRTYHFLLKSVSYRLGTGRRQLNFVIRDLDEATNFVSAFSFEQNTGITGNAGNLYIPTDGPLVTNLIDNISLVTIVDISGGGGTDLTTNEQLALTGLVDLPNNAFAQKSGAGINGGTVVTGVALGSHIGEIAVTTNNNGVSSSANIGVDHIIFSSDTAGWDGTGIPGDGIGMDGQLALSTVASAAYIKRSGSWSSYIFPSTSMATSLGDLQIVIDQALTDNALETVLEPDTAGLNMAIRANGSGNVIMEDVSSINSIQFDLTQYTSLLIGVGPAEITTTAAGYETDGLSYAHNGTTYYRLFASDGLTEILTTNQNNTDTGDIVYTKTY